MGRHRQNGTDGHLVGIIELADKILRLVDEAEQKGSDDQCSVVLGIARDCSYRLKASAEEELAEHARWDAWQPVSIGSGNLKGNRS